MAKPGSFTQIYIQLVFAVQNKDSLIHPLNQKRVFEYISGIITDLKHKSIIVNGVSDHVHMFIGMNPAKSISDTVHDIKRSSTLFINNENLSIGNFAWQIGYGGFSYSRSQIDKVFKYIKNQEIHHQKNTFKSEYIRLLESYNIKYDDRFLFDFLDLEYTIS
jgi:REP element-mobilizing transposase RayT